MNRLTSLDDVQGRLADAIEKSVEQPRTTMEGVTFQGPMYDVNGNSEVRIGGKYE